MSAAIERDERFGRLGPAAVGLLAPMLEADPSGDPAGFADSFAAAFERCAGVADSLGLRSLNYLFPLVAPYLREQSRAGAWRAVIERLEPWVCDLVALCAGELDPDQAVELVEALPGWPEFPRIPERFLNLIEARLREDAQRLTAGAHGALGASGDGVPVVDVALPPALALEVQTEPITVARDELALLLEATAALSAQLDARAPMAPMSQAGAEDVGERLRALAGALGHVGLSALAQALAALGALPATPRPLAWPAALAAALHRYFSDPDPASAGALVAQLGAPEAWLRFDPESLDALQRQLAWPRLLASRRVDAGVRRVQPADLSLDIPPDADAAVIDHLRRELPALSAQFSSSVDSILEGSVEALGEARRIAHTLKGSAITVGVRGVATLTHQLEDLLQLLDESRRRPPPLLGVALAEAADCLSQMTDAVAGHGDAPHDALTVCELLADWVHRLVSAPHASHEPDLSDLSDEPERLRAPEHGPPSEPERAHAPEHAPEPPLAPAHERPPQHAPAHAPAHAPPHAPAHAPAHAPPHAPPHAPERAPEHAPERAPDHAPERAPERAPAHEHAPHEREGAAHAAADDATVAAGREKPS
ncbi:MAG TPA: Hpt domain-containing protein, partial [Burkholderiaceae bacterium]